MTLQFPSLNIQEGSTFTSQDGVEYIYLNEKWNINNKDYGTTLEILTPENNQVSINIGGLTAHTIEMDANTNYVDISFENFSNSVRTFYLNLILGDNGSDIGYNVDSVSNDNVYYDMPTSIGQISGLDHIDTYISPDGTKLFSNSITTHSTSYTDSQGNPVYITTFPGYITEFPMTTPFDITTCSTGTRISGSGASSTTQARGLFFSTDGYKLFSSISAGVIQRPMTTEWDLNTVGSEIIYANLEGRKDNIFFSPDGLNFYYRSTGSNSINHRELTVAWDLNSASTTDDSTFVFENGNITDFSISNDGAILYVSNQTQNVYKYFLGTPWSLATIINSETITNDLNVATFLLAAEGDKIYLTSALTSGRMRQYSYTSQPYKTIKWDESIEWIDGSSPTISPNSNILIQIYSPDGETYYGIERFNSGE